MYSLLPACVSLVFLAYGAYVLGSRGASRVAMSFFLVCVTTFSWQFTWAILFQVTDAGQARVLAKAGYLLILFLPTTLYHFVTELTRRRAEMPGVLSSYALSMVLGVALFATGELVAGVERYFFGFYPVAGRLHPLHVLQTIVVVSRALYMLYAQQRVAVSTERLRLRYCLASLLIYFLAAVDYLCNYGAGFYPPGVIFIAISLGTIAQAIARHNLLVNPMMLAASVAHELRTPLATIRNQARILSKALPELTAAYDYAQRHGGPKGTLWPAHLAYLNELGQHIESEVARSNFIAEMVLASARPDALCAEDFDYHSVRGCVEQALATYPFDASGREKVAFTRHGDFQFLGSDTLLVYVMYNLIKNALAAVDGLPHGRIEIAISAGDTINRLTVRDTGHGIPEHVLPHVFDPFYTTRKTSGTGMGLAFCKRVLTSFGGTIRCRSHEGAFTSMSLEFPVVAAVQAA